MSSIATYRRQEHLTAAEFFRIGQIIPAVPKRRAAQISAGNVGVALSPLRQKIARPLGGKACRCVKKRQNNHCIRRWIDDARYQQPSTGMGRAAGGVHHTHRAQMARSTLLRFYQLGSGARGLRGVFLSTGKSVALGFATVNVTLLSSVPPRPSSPAAFPMLTDYNVPPSIAAVWLD